MRKIVTIVGGSAVLAAVVAGAVAYWRRNPRVGTRFVNVVVNPALLRRGLAGGEKSEIGTIEHVGRMSGIRRLTLVHPEPTADGFRVMVALGPHSEWARNVLAAGHCRLQLHELVYDLDEPAIVPASDVDNLPLAVRGVMRALGFQYLKLRTLGVNLGSLEPVEAPAVADDQAPEPVNPSQPDVEVPLGEPVLATN
jgi:hypothetical protein